MPQRPRNRLQRTLSLTQGNSKPANLFRRLSQRAPASPDQTSPDEYSHQSPPPHHRTSVDGYFSPPKTTGIAAVNGTARNVSAPLPIRPISTFHRQPTNLAAAKGGLAGQEINLENGLDIVINCEVSQRDPAGFTVPYRLLVPALWYAGDAQENAGRRRKESWISKLTSRRGSVKRRAERQGEGEWGGRSESETGSESESDRENMRYGPGKLGYRNLGPEATTGGNNARPQISNPQPISPQSVRTNGPVGGRQMSTAGGQPMSTAAAQAITPQPTVHQSPTNHTDPPGKRIGGRLGALGRQISGAGAGGGRRGSGSPSSPHSTLDYHDGEFTPPPSRRAGGKFDPNGNSKFFGGRGEEYNAGNDASGDGGGGGGGTGGYGGIEAYREKEKGWRRFF